MRLFKRNSVYYCHFYRDGQRFQRSTRCHDKAAAEAVARQFERDAADPDYAATRAASLSGALALLLKTREEEAGVGRRAPSTVSFYKTKCGHWVRLLEHDAAGRYAPFLLSTLRARDVDRYISARRSEGAGEHTIHKELVALRLALKLAKRAGLWRGDVDAICPVAFAPAYKPRKRWLPPEEVQRLLEQLGPDRAARVAFIVATSACWSESERAERADVAADLSTVFIRGTKRETRERTVPIATERQQDLMRFAVERAGGRGGKLFAPWSNVRHDLAAACRRAGLERCSPNDLRRTFAHWMRAEHVALEHIAPLMGHSTTKMVELVYGKLDAAELARAVTRSLAAPEPSNDISGAPTSATWTHQRETKADAGEPVGVHRQRAGSP
jgi:integrase